MYCMIITDHVLYYQYTRISKETTHWLQNSSTVYVHLVAQPVCSAPKPSVVWEILCVTHCSDGNVLVVDEPVCDCLDGVYIHGINTGKHFSLGDAATIYQSMTTKVLRKTCSANIDQCIGDI